MHGSTCTVSKGLDSGRGRPPWTYYDPYRAGGRVFRGAGQARPTFRQAGRIGVVGLGTGTIAAYGPPGQRSDLFRDRPGGAKDRPKTPGSSLTSHCRASSQSAWAMPGCGWATPITEPLDMLLVDAFSSDAIPLHLVTRRPAPCISRSWPTAGLLVVHISNRHLDLEPVLGGAGRRAGRGGPRTRRRRREASASARRRGWCWPPRGRPGRPGGPGQLEARHAEVRPAAVDRRFSNSSA